MDLDVIVINSDDDVFNEKIDEDLDYAYALSLQTEFDDSLLQAQFGEESNNEHKNQVVTKKARSGQSMSIIDKQWELIDPNPDIHTLFLEFNTTYFWNALQGVEVKWSPRMTSCAGVCSYEGHGGLCSVRLSLPLLKLRPRKDLVETLLHEMIHAYLFVTRNNKDHNAHGPEFLKHMHRINKETGASITVYHSFHDEVDLYRTHWWKCNGPCQKKSPFYGLVKRATNRAPAPNDFWWATHQATCGGTFIKIMQPEPKKRKAAESSSETKADIRSFFSPGTKAKRAKVSTGHASHSNLPSVSNVHTLNSPINGKSPKPFAGNGLQWGNVHTLSNTMPKNKGLMGGLRTSGASGSKTIVTKNSTKEKNKVSPVLPDKKEERFFTGQGHVLGGADPCAPISKTSILVQSPIPRREETNENKVEFDEPVFFSSDEDDAPYLMAELALYEAQTSNKTENIPRSITNPRSENSDSVNCPVCFDQIKRDQINNHLDRCLK